jgi:hypothetical protein
LALRTAIVHKIVVGIVVVARDLIAALGRRPLDDNALPPGYT